MPYGNALQVKHCPSTQRGICYAKSVLSVLGAVVRAGDELEITCEGTDEQEAMEAIVKLFESGLE